MAVALDDRPPGRPIGFYAPVVCPTGEILMDTLVVGPPQHRLTIYLLDRSTASKNDCLGLDAREVEPQPPFSDG